MAFEGLSDKLGKVFKKLKSHGKLTESDVKEAMREVRLALLEADVSYKVVKDFVAKVSVRAVGEEVLNSLTPAQQVIKIVNEELCSLMGNNNSRINFPSKPPCVIMMCGLQGSGKTTHSAKLAKLLKKEGHYPLLVACDIYRPAAINQLQVVGERAGVRVFEMGQISPMIIAKEAMKYAKDHGNDVVILDTAGRLHIDLELMDELKELKALTNPNEIMLVVDAMTGQDAVNVAKAFDDALGISSVLMSKLDSDTRGGAALSVLAVTGKPIKYVGMGEKLDDFEPFHPERMASRILGMGDVLTLIEKAESTVNKSDAEKLAQRLEANKFDMNDLLDQLKQIKKMGSIKSIIGMLPGVGDKLKDVDVDEKQFTRIEAMITSMTKAERQKPSIINPSRKRRIASGSGTKVEDVNRLLKQFEQMQKMMKQLGGKKGGKMGRKARKQLAGMNLDKLQNMQGNMPGNIPGLPPGIFPKNK
ncbi:MAG: signal recognition particle protein [Ruminococcus sp.]|nr:signal recognition particle protein [Ruminococcus sp.]